ncbi:MAG: PIN domain-containing protein [bacterium]
MSVYLDTSCLLKTLFPEPETARTLERIASEERVIVSSLGKVEALSHLHGRVAGGHLSRATARRLGQRLEARRVRRLLTNDDAQARAATHLGFSVLLPR